MEVFAWYRMERWMYLHHLTLFSVIIKGLIRILWGAVIPYQTQIGTGTHFAYQGLGVVLHKDCIIGENCFIRQHVTIGGGGGPAGGLPTIGNNCDIGCGAVILGDIHIGNNVKIGANSVVIHDLPDNCVAVGAPAIPVKFHQNLTKNVFME